MKQGTLFYDRESGRYNFHYTDEDGDRRDYGGIHCGEVFEFKLNDVWIPARMEMGMDDRWYLVGLPGLTLDGLFQVPLILNEVGGIFYAPLAQMGGAQGIKNIPDF